MGSLRAYDEPIAGIELTHQLHAVAFKHPGRHGPGVHTEGDRTVKGKCLVGSKKVIGTGVASLHRAFRNGCHHAQWRH